LATERGDAAGTEADDSDSEKKYAAAIAAGEDEEEDDELVVPEDEVVGSKRSRAAVHGGYTWGTFASSLPGVGDGLV
jgi:hypothetical protein